MKRRECQPASRYKIATDVEGENQPGSRKRVLRNLPGIVRKREMDVAEYEALLQAYEASLSRISDETRFTAALLCEMHHSWLGRIYEWAGRYRTVEMSKGGFQFPPAHMVERNMAALEAGALHENTPCRAGAIPTVAQRIAQVHVELLLIHPFRDGNGRLARWLADLMALQAGLSVPDYGFTGRGARARQERYLAAVMRGYAQDYGLLADFFAEAIERRLEATV